MKVHGWGNYPTIDANLITPKLTSNIRSSVLNTSLIPRGAGRSYGDSALSENILQTTYLDHFINFDSSKGILTCHAGISLNEVLKVSLPKGWFLPVTPGTGFVTLGGAIASDVHGKNHHIAGSFCSHVISITLMLGSGQIVTASTSENADLFHSTCGGMGLTGIILSASITLQKVKSSSINQKTLKAKSLDEIYELFEETKDSTYSVAWIDCLAKGAQLGRSVLMLGEHAEDNNLDLPNKKLITAPTFVPSSILNKYTVNAFNKLYYAKMAHNSNQLVSFQSYFYPLDAIKNWNRLYGKKGFFQYQFVLPKSAGISSMSRILTEIASSGQGSFLAVLKTFGTHNNNMLSFPIEGHTLALDFKLSETSLGLIKKLDQMVLDYGGKIYLTKDALMEESTFKKSYHRWQEFEEVRAKYNAIGKFSSIQSRRLGLQ